MLTPMTSPRELTSGPPELPGFRAASVWITLSMSRPSQRTHRSAQGVTMPAVTVAWKPYGWPMAMAIWPGRTSCESPSSTSFRSRRVDAHHGQVGVGIVAAAVGRILAAVGQRHLDDLRPMDDVAVRRVEPSGVNRKPEPLPWPSPEKRCSPRRPLSRWRTSRWTTAGLTFSTAETTACE